MRCGVTEGPIDVAALLAAVTDPACGAAVLFLGNVRDAHGGRAVAGIFYDGYRPMAEAVLQRLGEELESTHGVRLAIVHRLGELAVGETSVAIAAASPRRDAAFAATRAALERLKKELPVWKLERYADGTSAWREEERLAPREAAGAPGAPEPR